MKQLKVESHILKLYFFILSHFLPKIKFQYVMFQNQGDIKSLDRHDLKSDVLEFKRTGNSLIRAPFSQLKDFKYK